MNSKIILSSDDFDFLVSTIIDNVDITTESGFSIYINLIFILEHHEVIYE